MKHVGKSPEEVELQQKEDVLRQKQDELAELELSLSTLQGQLKSFEVEYYLNIGSKYVEVVNVVCKKKSGFGKS